MLQSNDRYINRSICARLTRRSRPLRLGRDRNDELSLALPSYSCLSCRVRFIPLHVLRFGRHTRARGLPCVSATVDPFSGYPHACFKIPFSVYFHFVLCYLYRRAYASVRSATVSSRSPSSTTKNARIALERAQAVRLPFLSRNQRASYGARDLSSWSGTTSVSVHAAPSALLNLGAYAASIRAVQNIRGGHSRTALSLSASSLVMIHILT